ncbi:uncharacterized protein MELLADRAFT_107288 [Melampsora larici-populina 98AG31]|uniref:Large ribosomal subunit protein bL32m n=1 Tax=Melampsora larici-populina (strain 98AG31 / pathotype 3-4-7) TaxID=747676 RepID=F4RNU4_MELLP|nr:uncharacterized protein MELLADRAFT_107288 [Melampsora larici-populina 98AG31]EGG05851.1 hypothetical protein MELLADRAFT_107288 [Melampsora larici-populina 98AG31]
MNSTFLFKSKPTKSLLQPSRLSNPSRSYHLSPSLNYFNLQLDHHQSYQSPPTSSSSSAKLIQWGSSLSRWISESILKAVPKKKVSHSRKRMRSAHKGIKPDLGLSSCSGCGQSKRKHHLCLECYADKVLEYVHGDRKPWDKGITP